MNTILVILVIFLSECCQCDQMKNKKDKCDHDLSHFTLVSTETIPMEHIQYRKRTDVWEKDDPFYCDDNDVLTRDILQQTVIHLLSSIRPTMSNCTLRCVHSLIEEDDALTVSNRWYFF